MMEHLSKKAQCKCSNAIQHSFIHFQGIGAIKEKLMWDMGVRTWAQLADSLDYRQLSLFPVDERRPFEEQIDEAYSAFNRCDASYFSDRLPKSEQYRIALTWPNETLFLDIETTGLSRFYDNITLVGWSIGGDYGMLLKYEDREKLIEVLDRAKTIVTFNGTLFDVPFLKCTYQNLPFPRSHVDLRFLARRVGFSGGQKTIEEQVGYKRASECQGMKGKEAPALWYRYLQGDINALEQLIIYNKNDIDGMKWIFDTVVQKLSHLGEFPSYIPIVPSFVADSKQSLESTVTQLYSDLKRRIIPSNEKPRAEYSIVFANLINSEVKSLGIDLTGSENRPSGIALLEGNEVVTSLVKTDQEILDYVFDAEPDVVSIDSPLSLPNGRSIVEDSDPTRETAGITRYCERVLRKRGVSVYPCLIKSMQALTARGISLACRMRKAGLIVIESFPGAAQDILNIPRKGVDPNLLKDGLARFGIKGEYLSTKVKHDELDAITSALVGHFLRAGEFEALGTEIEDYLILPYLHNIELNKPEIVIGLCGKTGSGKTTAGQLLEKMGFYYVQFSGVLAHLLAKGMLDTRSTNLQEFGYRIHKELGQRWLCKELLASVPPRTRLIVIDGLRYTEDYKFFEAEFGSRFHLMRISTTCNIRESRWAAKGMDREMFWNRDQHIAEAGIPALCKLNHSTIMNNGSIGEFYSSLFRQVCSVLAKERYKCL